ncbi:unnamed protein product [Lampetra fluviatilis]
MGGSPRARRTPHRGATAGERAPRRGRLGSSGDERGGGHGAGDARPPRCRLSEFDQGGLGIIVQDSGIDLF